MKNRKSNPDCLSHVKALDMEIEFLIEEWNDIEEQIDAVRQRKGNILRRNAKKLKEWGYADPDET